MKSQNQVILSIGTNQGNRLLNIEKCIALIHATVGTIINTSNVYENPSWGFTSTDFYNCAIVIHTYLSAPDVLEKVLAIETQLGRQRNTDSAYQARIIDIDLITFNEEIVATDRLQIPHPLMQNRNFVLLPMLDLNIEWIHPILKLKINELVAISTDNSTCKLVLKLENPLAVVSLQQYNYIVIEGNIGAGKTTLSAKMAEDFNAKLVLERFADNPFLPKFYQDQSRFAFPLEMAFLADRYKQLSDDLAQFDLFTDFIVADYHIFKSLIFAKITLAEDEYRLYRTIFDIVYRDIPKPDLYVYLYQNTPRLLDNIKKRGRDYEQNIAADYLDKINLGYLNYIKSQTDSNALIIDVSDIDFVANQEDYLFVLSKIKAKIDS
jgi:deoxyguanosine kinase